MVPGYEIPRKLIIQIAWAALAGRRRDFHADARKYIDSLSPPLCVLGTGNIPVHGPGLIVMNHYHRPGFNVWWLSMAITAQLPMPHTWMMSAEWTAPGKWYEPLKS